MHAAAAALLLLLCCCGAFQEELLGQHVFLGTVPMSVCAVRSDPGTLLNSLRNTVRCCIGWVVQNGVGLVEGVLHAAAWQ